MTRIALEAFCSGALLETAKQLNFAQLLAFIRACVRRSHLQPLQSAHSVETWKADHAFSQFSTIYRTERKAEGLLSVLSWPPTIGTSPFLQRPPLACGQLADESYFPLTVLRWR